MSTHALAAALGGAAVVLSVLGIAALSSGDEQQVEDGAGADRPVEDGAGADAQQQPGDDQPVENGAEDAAAARKAAEDAEAAREAALMAAEDPIADEIQQRILRDENQRKQYEQRTKADIMADQVADLAKQTNLEHENLGELTVIPKDAAREFLNTAQNRSQQEARDRTEKQKAVNEALLPVLTNTQNQFGGDVSKECVVNGVLDMTRFKGFEKVAGGIPVSVLFVFLVVMPSATEWMYNAFATQQSESLLDLIGQLQHITHEIFEECIQVDAQDQEDAATAFQNAEAVQPPDDPGLTLIPWPEPETTSPAVGATRRLLRLFGARAFFAVHQKDSNLLQPGHWRVAYTLEVTNKRPIGAQVRREGVLHLTDHTYHPEYSPPFLAVVVHRTHPNKPIAYPERLLGMTLWAVIMERPGRRGVRSRVLFRYRRTDGVRVWQEFSNAASPKVRPLCTTETCKMPQLSANVRSETRWWPQWHGQVFLYMPPPGDQDNPGLAAAVAEVEEEQRKQSRAQRQSQGRSSQPSVPVEGGNKIPWEKRPGRPSFGMTKQG
jgi:hypothetical protein